MRGISGSLVNVESKFRRGCVGHNRKSAGKHGPRRALCVIPRGLCTVSSKGDAAQIVAVAVGGMVAATSGRMANWKLSRSNDKEPDA
jgi:hypothetical protein